MPWLLLSWVLVLDDSIGPLGWLVTVPGPSYNEVVAHMVIDMGVNGIDGAVDVRLQAERLLSP
jgi:hypothetical protein